MGDKKDAFAVFCVCISTLTAFGEILYWRQIGSNPLTPAGISHGKAIFHTRKRISQIPQGIYFVKKTGNKVRKQG